MTLDEAIHTLNTLSVPTAESTRRLSLEEVVQLVNDPPKRPRSIPMETALGVIVEAVLSADENGRQTIYSSLTRHSRCKFLGFAARMSVQAVRENSPALIEQGLAALVIENGGNDWRDSIVALFQLYHSACKLGMDAAAVFAKIAELAEPGVIKKEIAHFPHRPPESRSLRAFCMKEEHTAEGFCYRHIPWTTK